jgi:hypothetical protein
MSRPKKDARLTSLIVGYGSILDLGAVTCRTLDPGTVRRLKQKWREQAALVLTAPGHPCLTATGSEAPPWLTTAADPWGLKADALALSGDCQKVDSDFRTATRKVMIARDAGKLPPKPTARAVGADRARKRRAGDDEQQRSRRSRSEPV